MAVAHLTHQMVESYLVFNRVAILLDILPFSVHRAFCNNRIMHTLLYQGRSNQQQN